MTEHEVVESAEVVPREYMLVPLLGLAVDPAAYDQVAEALASVRDAKRLLDEARVELERLLAEEAQRLGTKTLHFGDLDAVVSGGPYTAYDIEVLGRLQEAGLPEDRWNQLVKTRVEYRVDRNVLRQVRGAGNPEYEAIIEKAGEHVERPYRVDVKRA